MPIKLYKLLLGINNNKLIKEQIGNKNMKNYNLKWIN